LNVSAILDNTLVLFQLLVLFLVHIRKAPLFRNDNFLATGELVTSTSQSFLDNVRVRLFASHGQQDLSDVDTSDGTIRLAPGAAHTSLKPISTSTGQHLVDPDNMERVDADSQVERIFSGSLGDVFIAADSGRFKSFTGQLFVLIRNKMSTEGEVVNGSTFASQIENSNLRVGDTTVVSRFWVRLILAVAVAASRTTTHLEVYPKMT
jgi:hypothetical protein